MRVWLTWYCACLAFMKPWVWAPALCKLGTVAQEGQGVKVTPGYLAKAEFLIALGYVRPCLKKTKQNKTTKPSKARYYSKCTENILLE